MKTILIAALLLINLLAFILYGIDKQKAKRGAWRIPEATLLLVAALGGSVGLYWVWSSSGTRRSTGNSKYWCPCF